MDPLTAALHDCAHRFMPHMRSNQCAASIKYGDSYYTIVIGKQAPACHKPNTTAAASFAAAAFPSAASASASAAASASQSVLGKRHHDDLMMEPTVYDSGRSMYRCLSDENPLYNRLGHNFKE